MHQENQEHLHSQLAQLGLHNLGTLYYNLTPAALYEHCLEQGHGVLTDSGALAVSTGEFTGRSPKDRFIVRDEITEGAVWWGDINIPFSSENFDRLFLKMAAYLQGADVYVRDAFVCAHPRYRLNVRVITELPWSSLFAYNLFQRPEPRELENFQPDWHVICVPGFFADPAQDGTRQHNFAILNFTRRMVLIGGTAYTGEIKKSIFSALNFILPRQHDILSMHCSANVGAEGDTAIFFGLSGTGKTTLSSDPERRLIGDDEHGWSPEGIFNFEGGCYAKCIHLSAEHEPQIYHAIRFGALLENVVVDPLTRKVDYSSARITENTRVSYPIYHVDNIQPGLMGPVPRNIFFLTCDAYGVLPPISRLNAAQAMYHFISGYTAKIAGTEAGITDPVTTFSAGFGAAFLPLHPTVYAGLLGRNMQRHQVHVWLVNTGWTGGAFGTGSRIKLAYTRSLIRAALNDQLERVPYATDPIFGLAYPTECPGVPSEILNPRNTWADKEAYDATARKLAQAFRRNFEKYADVAGEEILAGAPLAEAVPTQHG
ncbi:MAG: phosphoenolpyruvate carboxykinase (ATP) [Flavobacteriales bacterium]|nr:phosphoenolpyruvate carboxykinase (ATP) [Flavobacteriales bacterium]MCX7650161.1 phosphoenolpyruvate carboxykinase (ATP) [Flavobacteriales bacterium]MDW8432847.1 phosphoenolpyruvate carboxykinase (ATP) [Flavobacteriales bacterium]